MNANNELTESFNLLTETLEGRTVDPYDNILVNIHDLSRCLDQVRKQILLVAPGEVKRFDIGMYLPEQDDHWANCPAKTKRPNSMNFDSLNQILEL